VLAAIDGAIVPGGTLVMHNNWDDEALLMHFDHSMLVESWLVNYEKEGEFLWRRSS